MRSVLLRQRFRFFAPKVLNIAAWGNALEGLVKAENESWVAGAGLSEAKEAPGVQAVPSNPGHPQTEL